MIEKKDWENALKAYETNLINALVNIEAMKFMVGYCEKEIAKFPKEDPMPEEAKEIIEAVK